MLLPIKVVVLPLKFIVPFLGSVLIVIMVYTASIKLSISRNLSRIFVALHVCQRSLMVKIGKQEEVDCVYMC